MSALDLLPQYVMDQIEKCHSNLREDLQAIPDAEASGWTVKFKNNHWHNSAQFSRNNVTVWWSHCWRAKHDDAPFSEAPRLYKTLYDALFQEGKN